jgi:hypothetical protein
MKPKVYREKWSDDGEIADRLGNAAFFDAPFSIEQTLFIKTPKGEWAGRLFCKNSTEIVLVNDAAREKLTLTLDRRTGKIGYEFEKPAP